MPPIIATAIGPKKSLRTSGIKPMTAAAALRVRQLLRRMSGQRRGQAWAGQALRLQLWLLQGLRPLLCRVPLRRDLDGSRDDLKSAPRAHGRPRVFTRNTPASSHGCVSATAAPLPVPSYLEEIYWWAYVHPWAVHVFEREWLVNMIMLGNYARLRDAALAELGTPVRGSRSPARPRRWSHLDLSQHCM